MGADGFGGDAGEKGESPGAAMGADAEEVYAADGDDVAEASCDFDDESFGEGVEAEGAPADAETAEFDAMVGALEEVMMDARFSELQAGYCDAHSHDFEDTDENKLSYTPVFLEWQDKVEEYLGARLAQILGPGFRMERLSQLLQAAMAKNPDLIESSEVFEMLYSVGDFAAFKDLMLSHKLGASRSFDSLIAVAPLVVRTEEMEDGDAHPELELNITPLSPR